MNLRQDAYAEIGTRSIHTKKGLARTSAPVWREVRELPLERLTEHTITAAPKLETEQDLKRELIAYRSRYVPFMTKLAPIQRSSRVRMVLTTMDWRIQKEEDKSNFQHVLAGEGSWEAVSIPHYGGPLGKAVTYYRKTFNIEKELLSLGSVYICFRGVDYKAAVFMNGQYLGAHEGFFAPFEFDCTDIVREGRNTLLVQVENDFVFKGNETTAYGPQYEGDKLYAATGPGYDDPELGWHHCPAGMGIYQAVYLESRTDLHIGDLYIRPLSEESRAEAWVEVNNRGMEPNEIALEFSLYGQNFQAVIFENQKYEPHSHLEIGLGDTYTEAMLRASNKIDLPVRLKAERGSNTFRFSFDIPDVRLWTLEAPWLYQLQVKLLDEKGQTLDGKSRHFGMRSFRMDESEEPRGRLYLNGQQIRLRGANTMGFEQWNVMKGNWDQLRDDILLAKICNMNYLRLTQRPVQDEVYDYCDMLGLMTQTDLPLFGVLRRNKFCEAVRQAEEMEKLVRTHPCNVLVSYINEPFPNANNKPHRHLTRNELEGFFAAADAAVRLNNPDRVIKRVDGDYDPPTQGLPDNHVYTCWYNGSGLDFGELHKGEWLPTKEGWNYGCGEFGAEGLDFEEMMRAKYPVHWLPQPGLEQEWSPSRINFAQSGRFHYFFYETPTTLQGWIAASQKHQAWATRFMTEAFRRNSRMVSFAIHLFIDAFPAGWMKTIMDADRRPKPAFFAYRDALTPLMVNLRTDRFTYYAQETAALEAWICNDTSEQEDDAYLYYQAEIDGQVITSNKTSAQIPICDSKFQGEIRWPLPNVEQRTTVTIRLALVSETKGTLHDTELQILVWPKSKRQLQRRICVLDASPERYAEFIEAASGNKVMLCNAEKGDKIILGGYEQYLEHKDAIREAVDRGADLIVHEWAPGSYSILDTTMDIKLCGMLPLHFASRAPALKELFTEDDFKLWYDPGIDKIAPILETTFQAENCEPLLTSGNMNEKGEWRPALIAAKKAIGEGDLYICQLKILGKTKHNPAAMAFLHYLLR